MTCSLHQSPAAEVLDHLYADAERQRGESQSQSKRSPMVSKEATAFERFSAASHLYMPVDRPFGNLLYALIRAARPQTIVEFGTSFGISTIFLAAAVRDNGSSGRIVTTEFMGEKAEVARKNLTQAGLIELIDIRVGDAIQTLRDPLPGPAEFLFLDGEKSRYLDVVKLVEPRMSRGCLIASDNTDQQGAQSYLEHVRDPARGYVTSALLTAGGPKQQSGHELSVRL